MRIIARQSWLAGASGQQRAVFYRQACRQNVNREAAINELTRLAVTYQASPEALAYLAERRAEMRQVAVLTFREAGVDAAGRPQFTVGEGGDLVTFAPVGEGVGWWLRAVKARPTGVVLTGRSPDATRKLLARGLVELEVVCRPLANELRRHGRPVGGAAVYCPAISSSRIVTG